MRGRLVFVFLAVPILLLGACSGSDGLALLDPAFVALAECSGDGLANIAGITDSMGDLLDAIEGQNPITVTYTPPNFTLDVDLNDDMVPDVTANGTVTILTGDPTDGFDVGESIQVDWSIPSGSVTGNGSFVFELTAPTTVNLTGTASLTPQGGCTFDITSTDLDFPLVDPLDLGPTGSFDFSTSISIDVLTGTMTFTGSQLAQVTASFEGGSVSFSIDLDTFTPVF